MLMVIFGAGASYDSAQAYRPPKPGDGVDGHAWRPPLANDLFLDRQRVFGNIITRYPKLTHIFPLLREPASGRSIEEVLESLQKEAEGYSERQCEFASVRYYIRDLFSEISQNWTNWTNGITNYAPLLDQILSTHKSKEPVCLVTFNYDLLLDNALYTFNFKPRLPEEHFDSHPTLKLFKLHGSVGWARFVDFPTDPRIRPVDLIEEASTIKLSNKYTLANRTETSKEGKLLFPAIAIPVRTKTASTFECPPFHLAYLGELLSSVTKILIVGWQAKEAHFLKLLRSNLQPLQHIMVVSGDARGSQVILEHFKREIGPNAALTALCDTANGGFTDFVVNQEGREFFKS